MGVDIYGVKPAVPEPLISEDATAEQLEAHWEWCRNTPGGYFQNSWWGWRPVQALINIFNHDLELGIPDQEIQSLGQNNGTGISSPEQCIRLAICFEEIAALMEQKNYNTLYLAAGSWEHSDGNHVPQATKALLSYKYQGIFYEPVMMEGEEFISTHRCSVDNLKRFAEFLKNCNGFKIH